MKSYKAFLSFAVLCGVMVACGNSADVGRGGSAATVSVTGDLSDREQAELVAATLAADKGGIGQDINALAAPASNLARPAASLALKISADIDCYDAQGNPQNAYDRSTTDRIEYTSLVQGELSNAGAYFQELKVDNRSDFTAVDLLSRTAWIDGTHSNHSSYRRTELLTGALIDFSLACDMTAIDVAVDLDAGDTFPEAGTIQGHVAGSYERTRLYSRTAWQLDFHFIVRYQGNNTAEIELSNGAIYIVHLDSGELHEQL